MRLENLTIIADPTESAIAAIRARWGERYNDWIESWIWLDSREVPVCERLHHDTTYHIGDMLCQYTEDVTDAAIIAAIENLIAVTMQK